MAIKTVPLELIDDNPYNPRRSYPPAEVNKMAHSIKQLGLLQIPKARQVNSHYQLAFGALRKRAFLKNATGDAAKWGAMPLDVQELTDEQMFYFALEENLQRQDITPVEVARSINNFLEMFPDKPEEEVAKVFNMTQANVSNMRRVLRLPPELLEKIDEGRISFTMGRELLAFDGLANAKDLMLEAVRDLKTADKTWGEPCTVEGMQKAVHSVARSKFYALEKEYAGYQREPEFDTRTAGCLKCDKMVLTHPTKSTASHWCTNEKCWLQKQQEHRDQAAAAAKAQMEADVLKRAAAEVPKKEPEPEKPAGKIVYVDPKIFSAIQDSYSADRISSGKPLARPFEYQGKLYVNTGDAVLEKEHAVEAYYLVEKSAFTGEVRTYSVPKDREDEEYYDELREDPNGFYHGMLAKRGKSDVVLVGPPVVFLLKVEGISQEIPRGKPEAPEAQAEPAAAETEAVAAEVLALAKEKVGTRAEVLDLKDISSGNQWSRQMKSGYILLGRSAANRAHYGTDELAVMEDPQECVERCIKGFHYAFDSRQRTTEEREVLYVCTDPKCSARKKGEYTRKVNAQGQARKKAEHNAIKEVLALVSTTAEAGAIPQATLKLFLYTQLHGKHISNYFYGGDGLKKPEKWLWDKLNPGTAEEKRTEAALFKAVDKLSDTELAQLVVEFCFAYLTYTGPTASYEIKTAVPLSWFGVTIPEPAAAAAAQPASGDDNGDEA